MTAIESPLVLIGRDIGKGIEIPFDEVMGIGEEPFPSYIELEFVFTQSVFTIKEMTDNEVLQLAESSNSLAFLDSPDEDIYNDLLKSKE